MQTMRMTHASEADVPALAALEALCFPPEEAASEAALAARVKTYGSHFYLLWQGETLVSFIDGFCTDRADLTDDMFAEASQHSERGAWQMLFGVNTHPDHRRQGHAGRLIRAMIADAQAQGRKGLVLTCKEALLPWYTSFGFVNEGISVSEHGGACWYQMRICFEDESVNKTPDRL